MNFDDYQQFVDEIRLPTANHDYARLGLAGELGELLGLYAKAVRDGPKADHDVNVEKELGDVLWFVAALASDHQLSLTEVAAANKRKLESRRDRGVLQGSGDNR